MVRQLVQIKASTLLYILFYLSIAVISLLPALAASSKELILLETVERQVETFLRLSHIEYMYQDHLKGRLNSPKTIETLSFY